MNNLKIKNFAIKAKVLDFKSVEFMTDLEKKKVYINFVKLLNNHFKFTLFKKNLYQYFIGHCGFIAHTNLNGFYGEYFETASTFHYNVNGYKTPLHECSGNMNVNSDLPNSELLYAIYAELNGSREGLGEFYDNINSNSSRNDDYQDIDNALKDAFFEYLEKFREEIRKAVKLNNQSKKVSEPKEAPQKATPTNLFDFMGVA